MATLYKCKRAAGIRWTARVRLNGRQITKTFGTKGAAVTWARAQEGAIETGTFRKPQASSLPIARSAALSLAPRVVSGQPKATAVSLFKVRYASQPNAAEMGRVVGKALGYDREFGVDWEFLNCAIRAKWRKRSSPTEWTSAPPAASAPFRWAQSVRPSRSR